MQIEIISSKSCPFAQRSRMVLLEKGIDFVFTEIDLNDKPDWFLKVSPYGKVPVIRHDGAVIWESPHRITAVGESCQCHFEEAGVFHQNILYK